MSYYFKVKLYSGKRMKRRKLKDQIIETSYALFRERGYNEVSVQDICDACDITKPTFYKYLASKENLLSYFFTTMNDHIPDSWWKIRDEDDPWNKIVEGFLFFYDHCERMGVDLYTEVFVSNLNIYKGTFNDSQPFTDLMLILIDQAKATGQIANPSSSLDLYKAGAALSLGYGAYWVLNNGHTDLKNDFVKGLEACLMKTAEVKA